jgi:hypothetical protein
VLRAAEETETTQENTHNWLDLGEGAHACQQLLTEEDIFFISFYQRYLY